MIVVSDTSPLNYLVLIDAIDVLPALFEEVYVPQSVIAELTRLKTPDAVRQWALEPPNWLGVIAPTTRLASTARLGDGEADAISLAKEREISEILIDERRGRHIAEREGLTPITTLAVLERAAADQLLDLRATIERLLQTNMRLPSDQVLGALERDELRRQQ